mmetsp:Transcript_37678/g.56368  ORF Transcript_37678/g.56368 Transcript_37678/m.56368 type:complete len:98 (+) Transcript_37678:350-643(+)
MNTVKKNNAHSLDINKIQISQACVFSIFISHFGCSSLVVLSLCCDCNLVIESSDCFDFRSANKSLILSFRYASTSISTNATEIMIGVKSIIPANGRL